MKGLWNAKTKASAFPLKLAHACLVQTVTLTRAKYQTRATVIRARFVKRITAEGVTPFVLAPQRGPSDLMPPGLAVSVR